MTLAQYLHSDSSSNPDENITDVLEQVSSLVDSNDPEQVDLYSEIHLSPKSSDAPLKLIRLLSLLIKSRLNYTKFVANDANNQIEINRLVSYLKSHVALLQALCHNADLATLFLVGQNGSQSFSEIQKSTLLEQSARTRAYIATLNSKDVETTLIDYKKNLEDFHSLPQKMKELQSLKKQVKQSTNVENLKATTESILATLETVLLFNDILIQNKVNSIQSEPMVKEILISKSSKSEDHQKIKKYKKEIDRLRNKVEELQQENQDKSMQSSSLEKEVSDLRKQNGKLINKIRDSSRKGDKVSNEFEALQAQKDQLLEDLSSLKSKLVSENKNIEIIQKLKEKLLKVETENRKMRKLLDEASINQQKINDQIDSEANDLRKDLFDKQRENDLLKKQISQLQEQIFNYQDTGSQKEKKIENMSDKINNLNGKVNDLTRTQSRLQNRINDLESLYKDATQQLDRAENSKSELNQQYNKLRKEIKSKTTENDELKAMLDRATADSQKLITDNAILIKQLRRCETMPNDKEKYEKERDNDNEIKKLKEKLKSAYLFIKKLQEQISEYKTRMEMDKYNFSSHSSYKVSSYKYNDNDSFEPYHSYNEEGPFCYSALDSKLNDLNVTIHQLEKTVHRSRKQTGISSSSE
ncbi:hypothetical protein TRFO_43167 [Tritrichomonas foetus]|uniref:Uncharacterized protein n=1 Tax=Tritrichomonas foetus TaxID=1144522 RepID=A0A1J4KT39_9EUKA|nr:hypothetical protein TRFO_43167 [Tritrichomonas foetus]|eukprot:OHT14048.1 hypothetical protein TRFO_43167 [Tritrichomonas foetus]